MTGYGGDGNDGNDTWRVTGGPFGFTGSGSAQAQAELDKALADGVGEILIVSPADVDIHGQVVSA